MTVKNCIPVPFSGTNSLVSLSVDLNFMYHGEDRGDPFDAMAVVTFLSSCPVLQDFSLALRNCRKFVASPLASGERLIIAGRGRGRIHHRLLQLHRLEVILGRRPLSRRSAHATGV